jgi:hypothetical protein
LSQFPLPIFLNECAWDVSHVIEQVGQIFGFAEMCATFGTRE